MLPRIVKKFSLLSASALILSACAFGTNDFSDAEKEMLSNMEASHYQPATVQMRKNIETQDILAQATFWSHEYQLNPADLEAAVKLTAAVRKLGNPGKAAEIAQMSRALHPNNPFLNAEYAAALIAAERGKDALEPLDYALRSAPNYARLWSLKGAALDQVENYDLARKHYMKALQLTPNDPNIIANLGLSYALSGDTRAAETWLRRALTLPGAGDNIKRNLDIVMQLQGETPTASNSAYGYKAPQGYPAPSSSSPHRTAQHRPQSPAPMALRSQPASSSPNLAGAYRQARTAPQQAMRQEAVPMLRSSQLPANPTAYSNPATPQMRSNITVVGKQAGQPQTATDMARAAAAQSQSRPRRIIRPYPQGQSIPPSQTTANPSHNILNQISQNVGPKPSSQPLMPQPPQPSPQNSAYPPVGHITPNPAPTPYNMATQAYPPIKRSPARTRH